MSRTQYAQSRSITGNRKSPVQLAQRQWMKVIRIRITPVDYYIGSIPGLPSTVVGTMLAGIGIFRRKTSQLFRELEA